MAPFRVEPILDSPDRPRWSVMIPTHNSCAFLSETLRSVLRQDPGAREMQIAVVDDCSDRDDPERLLTGIAGSRVEFHRHARNIGATANFNACVSLSRGTIVHILHSDDTVDPGFYARLEDGLASGARPGAAFCRYRYMAEDGHEMSLSEAEREGPGVVTDFAARIARNQRIQMGAIAVRRSVYEKLGAFDQRLLHAADWEMWVRLACAFPIWYEPSVLASYRMHPDSDTSRLVLTGANVADTRAAIRLFGRHLPPDSAMRLQADARRAVALHAVGTAGHLLAERRIGAAFRQVAEALRTSSCPSVARAVVLLVARTALGRI